MGTGRGRLLVGALVVAAVAILVFKVPVSTVIILAAVLACPLMMMGMHGGHGGGHGDHGSRAPRNGARPRSGDR